MELLMLLAALAVLAGPIGFIVALAAMGRARRLQEDLEELRRRSDSASAHLRRIDRLLEAVPGGAAAGAAAAKPAGTAAHALPAAPAISPPEPTPPPIVAMPPAAPSAAPPAAPQRPAYAPPSPPAARAARGASGAPARGTGESWEVTIGGSWLNRIGVALLVIGIAFALGYSLTVLGPAGKAALATAVSLALLAGGVALERREAYRFYGRGLIAGGWAALYATAYAVHELEATRIIENAAAGFALLLLVGVGMIVHSLRYRNQGLTALAYALAYAAIVLHSISAYTLWAAVLLGSGTVLHLLRRAWYGVAFGGIAATYGSLFLWYLRQPEMTPATLRLGLAILAINWVVFLFADLAREPEKEEQRPNARAVGLFNAMAAASLSCMAWARTFPGGAWQPLAALGAAYVVTSIAMRLLGRKTVQPMHSLAASALLAVAAHEGLSLNRATWAWLLEAQALVSIGVLLRDRFHRRLGCILFLAPMTAIVVDQAWARLQRADGLFDLQRALLTAVACGCFYFNFGRLRALAAEGHDEGGWEETMHRLFSYAALALILIAIWVQLPAVYVAPAGGALALLLFEVGGAARVADLRLQAYLASLYAAFTALVLSAPSRTLLGPVPARVPALLALAVMAFIMFLRQRESYLDFEAALRPLFSWGGSILAALVVWLEARPVQVGPDWMILALLLVEAGLALREPHLRRPGYVALAAAHGSLALSNLSSTEMVSGWSVRVVTIVPAIAATYYLWWRLRALPQEGAGRPGDDLDEKVGRLLSYLGAGTLALFVRFQFGLEGASFRWSLAMVGLFVAGHLLGDADFRLQAYGLAAAVFVRAVGFDFVHANPILGMDGPAVIVNAGAICYLAAGFLVRARREAASSGKARPDRRTLALEAGLAEHGHDILWSLAVALVALYLYRTRSGFMLIVAWAIEGLLATVAGFAARARALRVAGLVLLGIGLAMTLVRAFTTFDTVGRIVSFLVLGIVLLLISFAYTRYRDSLRKAP